MPHRERDNDTLNPNRSFSSYQRDPCVRDRYCRGCLYNLRDQLGGECPECGLPFSLTNPRTYLTSDQLPNTKIGKRWFKPRALYFLTSLSVAWALPYSLGFILAVGFQSSASTALSDLAALGCCVYFVAYPLTIMIATVFMLNALMPDRVSGIAANLLAGSLFAGILISGQLILILGFMPLMLVLGIIVGLPAGLWRAHRQT